MSNPPLPFGGDQVKVKQDAERQQADTQRHGLVAHITCQISIESFRSFPNRFDSAQTLHLGIGYWDSQPVALDSPLGQSLQVFVK